MTLTWFQIIFIPLSLLLALAAFLRTRFGRRPKRQGLFWMAVWSLSAFLIAFPNSTTVVANWLGIKLGINLIVYLAVLAGLWLSLHFHERCRQLEIMVTELVRWQSLDNPKRGPLPDANDPGAKGA